MVLKIIMYLLVGFMLAFSFKGIKCYINEIRQARKKKVEKDENKA